MNGPSSPRSRPRLQFSLRGFLLVLVALAIGFPVWYRWPYQKRELLSPPGSAPVAERVTNWQRQWGGTTVRQGLEQRLKDGQVVEQWAFERGRLHGPYFRNGADGQPELYGSYVDGLKDGVWVDKTSPLVRTSTWRRGTLHGPYTIAAAGGEKLELYFAAGHLTQFRGQPAQNRLYELLETGQINGPLAAQLRGPTSYRLPKADSLLEVIEQLKTQHSISIVLDSRILQTNFDFAREQSGLDLCSALTVLTVPHGLACDYRYDCIWITLAGEAGLPDPTGVSDLKRAEIAAPAAAWTKTFDLAEPDPRPLADVLVEYGKLLGVPVDVSRLPPEGDPLCPRMPATLIEKERWATILGLLLSQYGCRCRVAERQLVIERQSAPEGKLWVVVVNARRQAVTLELDTQRVRSVNGQFVDLRLQELTRPAASDAKLAADLAKVMPVGLEFAKTPLREAVAFISDQHGLEICLDPSLDNSPMKITLSVRGEPLYIGLSRMSILRLLGWDYRYGRLWLTRADDLGWSDPTGVSEIVPPAESQLAAAWNRALPVGVELVRTPLSEALASLTDQRRVEFDVSKLGDAKNMPVTMCRRNSTLKDVLGELLYRLDCTCRLNGETLVIIPPAAQ